MPKKSMEIPFPRGFKQTLAAISERWPVGSQEPPNLTEHVEFNLALALNQTGGPSLASNSSMSLVHS